MTAAIERGLSREELNRRFKEFGLAATERLVAEVESGDGAIYDMIEDADIIQLENPTPGGAAERWEVRVDRYGDEVLVAQLFYSDAGRVWQTGQIFFFSREELAFDGEVVDLARGGDQEAMMADDNYYRGLVAAMQTWPMAKTRVITLEETLPEDQA